MVQKTIRNLEKHNALAEISILKAIQMLVSTWNTVPTETIVNCFVFTANQEVPIADEDDSFKDLENEIDALRKIQLDLLFQIHKLYYVIFEKVMNNIYLSAAY